MLQPRVNKCGQISLLSSSSFLPLPPTSSSLALSSSPFLCLLLYSSPWHSPYIFLSNTLSFLPTSHSFTHSLLPTSSSLNSPTYATLYLLLPSSLLVSFSLLLTFPAFLSVPFSLPLPSTLPFPIAPLHSLHLPVIPSCCHPIHSTFSPYTSLSLLLLPSPHFLTSSPLNLISLCRRFQFSFPVFSLISVREAWRLTPANTSSPLQPPLVVGASRVRST